MKGRRRWPDESNTSIPVDILREWLYIRRLLIVQHSYILCTSKWYGHRSDKVREKIIEWWGVVVHLWSSVSQRFCGVVNQVIFVKSSNNSTFLLSNQVKSLPYASLVTSNNVSRVQVIESSQIQWIFDLNFSYWKENSCILCSHSYNEYSQNKARNYN